jgi:hypothetical protein
MSQRRMHLPERQPVPEIHDKHPTGDCHCRRPMPSGGVYTAGTGRRWEACALCGRIPPVTMGAGDGQVGQAISGSRGGGVRFHVERASAYLAPIPHRLHVSP